MKAIRFSFILLSLLSVIFLSSCEKINGKGDVITETRTVSEFQTIDLAMTATVYYTQGEKVSCEITGQQNILNQIITSVDGTTLNIGVKKGVVLRNFEPVRIYLTAPSVNNLNVSGSGDIFIGKTWVISAVSISISGSGNVNIEAVEASDLEARISGSGLVQAASGRCTSENLTISGSGSIDLRSVGAAKVFTTISGSGDAYVYASEMLDVTISGSGNLWYYGSPAVYTNISGSGSLRRM